jgi:hypothetical protein
MADTKYGKYLTRDCIMASPKREGLFLSSTRHLKDFGGDISVDAIYIKEPQLMITQPHRHEFPQYLHFFSANPENARDFDAEIHITLGEEAELHVIDSPTAVHIPARLDHGPLNFARIGKPVLFIDIAVTGSYSRIGNTED